MKTRIIYFLIVAAAILSLFAVQSIHLSDYIDAEFQAIPAR